MSETYRVAIIGCGRRARLHAAGVKAEPRFRVVALADLNLDAAKGLNEDFGFGAAVYGDYEKLLAKERPDVVVACLWTPLHLPVYRAAVEAGVRAVLSEKPMAPTWGECVEMAALADRSNCLLSFCHQRRFAAGNRLVRDWLAEGRFGRIVRMDLYSPRCALDCGTHTIDQALSFNGETPAQWVMAATDLREPKDYFGVPAEAMMVGMLVFANGVRANIQVGGPDMDMPTGVRVYGTRGFVAVRWPGIIQEAVVYDEPGWKPPAASDAEEDHMAGVVRDLIDALETGRESEVSHVKALRASEIIFAFYESARRRERVDLPLTGVTDHPLESMLAGVQAARELRTS